MLAFSALEVGNMAAVLVQTNSQEFVRPGALGRAIRACLGLATLSLLTTSAVPIEKRSHDD